MQDLGIWLEKRLSGSSRVELKLDVCFNGPGHENRLTIDDFRLCSDGKYRGVVRISVGMVRVRIQRSSGTAIGPRISESRPATRRRLKSLCQVRSCAWTKPCAKSTSAVVRA